MSFFKSLLLVGASSVGTAIALDRLTDGAVSENLKELKNSFDDYIGDNEFEDYDDFDESNSEVTIARVGKNDDKEYSDWDLLYDPEDPDNIDKMIVMMPVRDAFNIQQCVEESISKLNTDPEHKLRDFDLFGDKALSFEKLYDMLEPMVDELFADMEKLKNSVDSTSIEDTEDQSIEE